MPLTHFALGECRPLCLALTIRTAVQTLAVTFRVVKISQDVLKKHMPASK